MAQVTVFLEIPHLYGQFKDLQVGGRCYSEKDLVDLLPQVCAQVYVHQYTRPYVTAVLGNFLSEIYLKGGEYVVLLQIHPKFHFITYIMSCSE
jgi:hypothetical protein